MSRIWQQKTALSALAFLVPHSDTGKSIGKLLRLTPSQLELMAYGTEEETVCRFLGHTLSHEYVSAEFRRYCPICLSENPYHRAFWDLSLVTVCPAHGVRLLTHCPQGHRIGWTTDHVHLCSRYACRADLREAPVERVHETDLSGVRGLLDLFQGVRPKGFAPFSPGDALDAAFNLGLIVCGREHSPRPIQFASKHPGVAARVLTEGLSAIENWSHGFRAMLDRLRTRASARPGQYGMRKQFGFLPVWLGYVASESYGALLRDTFYRYVAEQTDLATPAHRVRRFRTATELRHRHITGTEAAKVLGISYERLAALAAAQDLYFLPPTGKGPSSFLRADRVHELLQQRSARLSKLDVVRHLGVGKRTVEMLRRAGLVTVVPDPDDPEGILYDRDSVQGLLESVRSRVAEPGSRVKQGITIAGVARRVSQAGFGIPEVLKAIQDGRIAPTGISRMAQGLQKFRFRPSEANRFVAELTTSQGRTLSVVEAAEELGVKQEVAYHWVRTGLLATVTMDNPLETGRRVTQSTLAAFRAEYITGPEFARLHRLGRRWAGKHLVEVGILPIAGPSVDGSRQYLFRRGDLAGLDVRKLVSGSSELKPKQARARRLDRSGSRELVTAIGRALRREFGDSLVKYYHCFRDERTGSVIQAMTAGNIGVAGTYLFLISSRHRARLAAAGHQGLVAFGFADRSDFLLVPWREVEPALAGLQSFETGRERFWHLREPHWRTWSTIGADGNAATIPVLSAAGTYTADSPAPNFLMGTDPADLILGGNSDLTVEDFLGSETIFAGSGNETVETGSQSDSVEFWGNSGTSVIRDTAQENIHLGSGGSTIYLQKGMQDPNLSNVWNFDSSKDVIIPMDYSISEVKQVVDPSRGWHMGSYGGGDLTQNHATVEQAISDYISMGDTDPDPQDHISYYAGDSNGVGAGYSYDYDQDTPNSTNSFAFESGHNTINIIGDQPLLSPGGLRGLLNAPGRDPCGPRHRGDRKDNRTIAFGEDRLSSM